MPTHAFLTFDVFTRQPFGGNPLAIFPDARGLSSEAMQSIATEFNLSESVFFLPPSDGSDAIATVRIFTPVSEIPFAGHPNVGASFYVAREGGIFGRECGDQFKFEELAGPVECRVVRDGETFQTQIRAPKPLEIRDEIEMQDIADCAGLPIDAISKRTHPPVLASVGLPFAIAELDSLDSLAAASPVTPAFAAAHDKYRPAEDRFSLYLYVRDPADPSKVRSRMFAPLSNIPEDPATGSAAAALTALLASFDGPDEERRYEITQGVEMGRRSDIVAVANSDGVRIGGHCVPMQEGTLRL